MKFDSLAQQGNAGVAKNLKSGLGKNEIIIAAKIVKFRKVERVSVLKVPVIFENFLKSFSLSLCRSFRVVVNPVEISLDEQAMLRKQKDAESKKIFCKDKDTKGKKETVVSTSF